MKKIFISFMGLIILIAALAASAAQKTTVEILYMNHGPLLSTLKEINNTCAQYKDSITVFRYDFDSPEGEQFMHKKGINQHIPLMIWINGKSDVSVKGKEIKFSGFPSGSGPAFVQGKWTMEDLRSALNSATQKK